MGWGINKRSFLRFLCCLWPSLGTLVEPGGHQLEQSLEERIPGCFLGVWGLHQEGPPGVFQGSLSALLFIWQGSLWLVFSVLPLSDPSEYLIVFSILFSGPGDCTQVSWSLEFIQGSLKYRGVEFPCRNAASYWGVRPRRWCFWTVPCKKEGNSDKCITQKNPEHIVLSDKAVT